jgi:membrane protein
MKLRAGPALQRARKRFPGVPVRFLRGALVLREVLSETVRGFQADRGVDLAGSLAFASLVAAVPLLATFAFFLAAFFKENVGTILDIVNAILPYHTARVTENLRDFVSESSAITGIGLILLVIASLRLVFIVEGIFNVVWGAPKRRAFWKRLALYTFVLLALAVLLGSLALGARVLRRFGMGGFLDSETINTLFPLATEFAALTLLYRFLPSAKVGWGPAATAGSSVAFSLEVLRNFFRFYVRALSRMNLITGSLTLILFTLLSIYLVWVLVLLGVELTHVLQTGVAHRRVEGGRAPGRAENAIRMLLVLASEGPHTFAELSERQQGRASEAKEMLECLRDRGLVEGEAALGYRIARRAEKITVAEVVDAISPNLYALSSDREDRVALVLEPLFHRLDGERRALLDTTLAELGEK